MKNKLSSLTSLDDLPAVDGLGVQVVLLQLVTVDGVQRARVEVGLSAAGVEGAVTCPATEAQTWRGQRRLLLLLCYFLIQYSTQASQISREE